MGGACSPRFKTQNMKNIFYLLFLISFSVSAQTPMNHFFKLIEWGEGAHQNLLVKEKEHISRLIPLEDGYLIEYNAISEGLKQMMRITRLDFDLNVIWETEFDGTNKVGDDYFEIYVTHEETQNDIIIDDQLYSLSRCAFYENSSSHYDGLLYYTIDMNTGELLFSKLLWDSSEGLYQKRGFYRYQDSLFMFSGWESELPLVAPLDCKIHILNRSGEVVKKIDLPDISGGSKKVVKLSPKEGGFNILYTDYVGSEDKGTPLILYSGALDSMGNLLYADSLNHLAFSNAIPGLVYRGGLETTLDNGNRFVVVQVDTTRRDDLVNFSVIYRTFLLNPDGKILKDSIYNLSPNSSLPLPPGVAQDTFYNVGNICKAADGTVYVAGGIETFYENEDNYMDLFVAKYDETGTFLWRKHYKPFEFLGSFKYNEIWVTQIHEDKDGGIVLCGKIGYLVDTVSSYPDNYTYSGFILKLGVDGCYGDNCGGQLLDVGEPLLKLSGLEVHLYPNPVVSDVLNVEVVDSPYDLEIMDVEGKVFFSKEHIQTNKKEINTKKWPEGLYFVKIKVANQIAVKTINITR